MYTIGGQLYHHGVLGQKWGTRNGPPYPLSASSHSASERKAGYKKSIGGGRNESLYDRKKVKKTNVNVSKLGSDSSNKGSIASKIEDIKNKHNEKRSEKYNKKAEDNLRSINNLEEKGVKSKEYKKWVREDKRDKRIAYNFSKGDSNHTYDTSLQRMTDDMYRKKHAEENVKKLIDKYKDEYNKNSEKSKQLYNKGKEKVESLDKNGSGKMLSKPPQKKTYSKMSISDSDSAVTKRVKDDFNKLSNTEFMDKYHVDKGTYEKRVKKYGDPYMNSPLAKWAKKQNAKKRKKK